VMGSYSSFKYVAAAVMAALLLASASLWTPPRNPHHVQRMTTITTVVKLGRGSNITLTPIPTPKMPSPRAAPNVSRGVMTPSPAARYPRFAFLMNLIRELGAILNSIAAAFLSLLNAIARLFSISPQGAARPASSAAGRMVNPYALALASLVVAAVAAAVLRATLLKRRRFKPPVRRGFAGPRGPSPGQAPQQLRGGGGGDPLVELVRLLARRAGEELKVNSDALTHRDLMRVCRELRSVSAVVSPSEVADLLRAYELRRFAGASVGASWVAKAEGILRRLGGSP